MVVAEGKTLIFRVLSGGCGMEFINSVAFEPEPE